MATQKLTDWKVRFRTFNPFNQDCFSTRGRTKETIDIKAEVEFLMGPPFENLKCRPQDSDLNARVQENKKEKEDNESKSSKDLKELKNRQDTVRVIEFSHLITADGAHHPTATQVIRSTVITFLKDHSLPPLIRP